MGLSAELGQFISSPFFCKSDVSSHGPELSELRTQAFEIIKMGLTDTVATMFAGRDEEVAKILFNILKEQEPANEPTRFLDHSASKLAPVPAFGTQLSVLNAAFLNSTLGHALDYDDVALSGHPSVVLGPAVLAVAHALNASGERALEAYWVGYEVWAELLGRESDPYHLKGWHPTAVLGTVACAAAVANLYRLNASLSTHVISLAASMASGLTANFGSMSKPMQAGRAVSNAIMAVNYVLNGMRASSAVFESKAGFLNAISPHGRVDLQSGAKCLSASTLLNSRLSIKQYPMCYSAHRVIDGVLDAIELHGFKSQDVVHVKAWIGPAQASMLRNPLPQNALQAKFSLEFAVACSLMTKRVSLSELNDEFVLREETQNLMKRVKVEIVQTVCPIDPAFSLHDRVLIQLNNGVEIDSGDIRFPRGNAYLPLTQEALKQKFLECCDYGQFSDREQSLQLYKKLTHLENLQSIRTLFSD